MFKKFDEKESISGVQQLKSSVQKGIRTKLLDSYPYLEGFADVILPKKDAFRIVKCHDHIEILVNGTGEHLFFRHREGSWMPTLRLLHKYPFFLPMEQVDKGAIRFVLSGANIMCPGLTSPGACMTPAEKGTVVAIMAEGKEQALAIGITTLSTEDIHTDCLRSFVNFIVGESLDEFNFTKVLQTKGITKRVLSSGAKVNKGVGVENCHYLNDGLWHMKAIK